VNLIPVKLCVYIIQILVSMDTIQMTVCLGITPVTVYGHY